MGFFYPAAALFAAVALPWSVFFLRDPLAHAHEMLFGFALAVVAGNQLGTLRGPRIAVLAALWIAARAAFLAQPYGFAAAAANAAFALLFAWLAAPRLLRAAKKLRNRALPAILVGLAGAAAAFHALHLSGFSPHAALRPALLLLAMLMLFMGGRLLAPAIAGQMQRQGMALSARVQPRLEGALLLAGAAALGFSLFSGFERYSALACMLAGGLAAIRLARWRLWRVRGRPDLLCIAAGYAWLALGLVALGVAAFSQRHASGAVHLVTVGALGTLTFNVMAWGWLLRARQEPARCALLAWGTALLAGATLCRVLGFLAAAASLWSAAFLLLLALFLAASRRAFR